VNSEELQGFAVGLCNQVVAEAHLDGEERFLEEVFVSRVLDILHEAQELENAVPCSYRGHGMKVDAYDLKMDENAIDLLVADYRDGGGGATSLASVTNSDTAAAFKRATTFLLKGRSGHHPKLEESSEGYDLARLLHEKTDIVRARVLLLTNGVAEKQPAATDHVDGLEIQYQTWDIERLYRLVSSGLRKEPVDVDFAAVCGAPLPCLRVETSEKRYSTFVAAVPGEVLFSLYDKWGTRILERNVRAYLQARGKVNRGIRETLIKESSMFLAYNNGITATAAEVSTTVLPDGRLGLSRARDFQVVNGGQTVASIWHAKREDHVDLAPVAVLMKLSDIPDPVQVEQLAPLISKYSNTQNKVNTADFHANDPYQTSLEQLSRTTWAPDPTGGGVQTIWFYERSRGSYDETRNRERTAAKIRAWDAVHPRRQRFDKIQLAKVEKTWMLQPHIVSRGGEKNFADYTIDIKESGRTEANVDEFKGVVAKLMVWKRAERLVTELGEPGYRANIVTYATAWLLHLVQNRLDLMRIWDRQEVGEGVVESLRRLTPVVRKQLTGTTMNVTEWCKKVACWQGLCEQAMELPSGIQAELLDTSRPTPKPGGREPTDDERKLVEWVASVPPEVWFNLSRWGKVTKLTAGFENSICYSIGRLVNGGKMVSYKQAVQGKRIMEKAKSLGFKPDESEGKAE
jgi:hypothetical protein